MFTDSQRRWLGIVLGAILGVTAGIITQFLNRWLLPGLPLYQPPFGPFGNTLLILSIGGVLGLLIAWTEGFVEGAALGSIGAALMVFVFTLVTGTISPDMALGKLVVLIFMILPLAGLLAVFTMIFRWVIDQLREANHKDGTFWRWYIWPLVITLAVGGLAFTAHMPALGQTVSKRMETLVQSGLNAGDLASLPVALNSSDLTGDFHELAQGAHTLEWTKNDITHFAIPSSNGPAYLMSVAIARFENGWDLVCLYPDETREPECRLMQASQP